MSPTPSPFGANPRRYHKVPKRVKNPRVGSGCAIDAVAVVAIIIAFFT